ncbi:span like RimI family protein amino acetyltransferase [Cryptosporidium canis]|uniref:N-alpha-acetyltransferase 60 n=1 Tax=Cryptosporidium canis TaxID=195482 RepID=A0ABQ8P9H9_9CRYT|nr:span like RimI family protein amino acetyltransferase [Cryptosporidium canis]KAJ1615012.1 span like RimI family protein amino acetyltransferase [Cryptosporidium canis]
MTTISSAFPPELKNPDKCSRVHDIYQNWRQENPARNPIIDFRRVLPEDVTQLEELHRELFPIIYDRQFYDGIASGLTHGWVAVWKLRESLESSYYERDELVVGFVTTSQDCRIIKENDYKHVIKNIPEPFLLQELREKIQEESFEISPSPFGENVYKYLVYILTMGVVEEFRFLGIAKQLLNTVIGYYQKFYPSVNAIFLHVVDYNTCAINLYKRLKFEEILHWNNFYKIRDGFYGSYLFSYYYDRSNSRNIFDSFIDINSNNPVFQPKKHGIFDYINRFISSSSKLLRTK